MDRMACVDLPAYPLQLLLQRHPEWRGYPAAVVDRDSPQGRILWVNERARSSRILPGIRYAAALSLASDLRAAEISPTEIEAGVASMSQELRLFTPHIEPAAEEPGVFWLDATGFERLHGSSNRWANLIQSDLKRAGFSATVAVGFSRFGTYAVAKARRSVVVLRTPENEAEMARRVPLDCLALEPEVRDALAKLGIRTVGALLDLPSEGMRKRFGNEMYRLHRLASGELWAPLHPQAPEIPAQRHVYLDHPERDVGRLLCLIEGLLEHVLRILAEKSQALTEVHLHFTYDGKGSRTESLRPAEPTLDGAQLLHLIRLRLESTQLPPGAGGVVEVEVGGEGIAATQNQMQLFAHQPRRDLAAANRALARLRAELGAQAVVHARLRAGHLPEGGFSWEALAKVPPPKPRRVEIGALVRRIFSRPIPLPSRSRRDPDGWMLGGLRKGPVVRLAGPYIVAGGWWRKAVHREYHFAETQKGELLWVYYDRPKRRWFLQGRVE